MKAGSPLPPETSPGAPRASPGAGTEEMHEGTRLCTPPHCCVTGLIPVPRSSSITGLQIPSRKIGGMVSVGMPAGSPGPAQSVPVEAPGRCPCLQA